MADVKSMASADPCPFRWAINLVYSSLVLQDKSTATALTKFRCLEVQPISFGATSHVG